LYQEPFHEIKIEAVEDKASGLSADIEESIKREGDDEKEPFT